MWPKKGSREYPPKVHTNVKIDMSLSIREAVEALYEVTGFDRMNLDAMVVYLSSLDYGQIWGGELTAR